MFLNLQLKKLIENNKRYVTIIIKCIKRKLRIKTDYFI